MFKLFKSTFVAVAMTVAAAPALAAERGADELPGWVIAVAAGIAVAIGLMINRIRQRTKNVNVWASMEPILRKGPATLQELADGAGMSGFLAKGKIALALQDMTAQGRVEVIEARLGTPQLEKVKFIKYKLRS